MSREKYAHSARKKYELVPPDGGWAYMICVAMVLNVTAILAFVSCTGMIFNDFYIELGMGTMDVQLLNGINSMGVAISSFATGPLTKVMSMRKLAFISSALFNVGVFGTVFVNSRVMLFLCQGLLQSVGEGMLYNVTCTSINEYFLRKRFLVTSLAQTIVAAAVMMAPLAINWTSKRYGYRGAIILMLAASMQTFVGSALMQPVKWHQRREPVAPETIELLTVNKYKYEETTPGLEVTTLELTNNEQRVVDNINNISVTQKDNSFLYFVKIYLDWTFLKKFLPTCTCLGIPLSLVSDVMFTLFLPQYLYNCDWKKDEVAWALSLLSFGDIATRIFLIVASKWLAKLSNHLIYIIGMAADVLSKLILLSTSNATVAYTTLTLTGCSRCIIMVLFPLVISDSAPPENYTTGFGTCILLYGLIGITLGPAIGAVRDATGEYTVMFYALNGLMAAVAAAWSIELFYKRKRKTVVVQNTRPHD